MDLINIPSHYGIPRMEAAIKLLTEKNSVDKSSKSKDNRPSSQTIAHSDFCGALSSYQLELDNNQQTLAPSVNQYQSRVVVRTPKWLHGLLGTVIYVKLSSRPPASSHTPLSEHSTNSEKSITYQYQLPSWLGSYSFEVRPVRDQLTGFGGTWNLHFPVYVPSSAVGIISLLEEPTTDVVQLNRFMRQFKLPPRAVVPWRGDSLLEVKKSIGHSNRQY
jgi:hypothetical protein